MNRVISIALVCLAISQANAQVPSDSQTFPTKSEYAWGFPIVTGEESSFYSVRLPLEVNQSVTDPTLRDAGVYNGDGEPVPRIFKEASDDVEQIERVRQLPFVPLFNDSEPEEEEIELMFERRGDYARLELNTTNNPEQTTDRSLVSYLIDTRELDDPVESLDLYWTQVESGFIGEVTVEGSNDLRDWKRLASGAVAELNESSTSIVQRRVKLSDSSHDYLRLSWSELPDDWGLTEVNAIYTIGVPGIVRETTTLSQSGVDPDDGERIFSLGGAPGIDRIRIVLPERNTVITANIFLWSETQNRWYRIEHGSWHHIGRDDNTIVSAAINVSQARSSRIKVVVTHGQPDVEMQLDVGWRPDTLIFLAQGPAPYTLVSGRAADRSANYPHSRHYGVQSIARLANNSRQAATATLGPRFSLGGSESLDIDESIEWQTLILWLGLALGVAFVGFMATRILRESKTQ